MLRLEKFIKLTFPKLRALQMIKEDPNDPEREQKRAALRRYEDARRQHLGNAVNLLFGLSVAGSGFGMKYLVEHGGAFVSPASRYLFSGTVAFVLTVLWCLTATFTRLRDFRLTARKLRRELEGADETEVGRIQKQAELMGKCTWGLFYLQLISFAVGVVLFALWFL